ncbi:MULTISPECIES: plasmid mobilization protein [Niastella]|uniref:Plasmid mobilization relaxosome protein MobC n=1 Tax=Niastella soli TaxID=2821487 RepID=A0ABS3YZ80_9BACT|nr:plasmid mobilization relaxosome protein MobC [Niastella soli]MBO9203236.1 plasmid mobilization relaxosome protein MobC [Niastella soli]
MKQEERKNRSAGRPAKIVKKDINASVRFTSTEHNIVKEKAKDCGLSVSNYIRKAAIYNTVIPRLTEEERQFARQLVGMANNLNQLVKVCHQEGLLQTMAYFGNYRQRLDEVLKKLKP